jgi:hypothetical protein
MPKIGHGGQRAERRENGGRPDDSHNAENAGDDEPDQHHRPEYAADKGRAIALYEKQNGEDHDRQRDHGAPHLGRINLQPLDCAQDRNRRRDRAVAVQQGGADEADHDHGRPPFVALGAPRADQSEQRQNSWSWSSPSGSAGDGCAGKGETCQPTIRTKTQRSTIWRKSRRWTPRRMLTAWSSRTRAKLLPRLTGRIRRWAGAIIRSQGAYASVRNPRRLNAIESAQPQPVAAGEQSACLPSSTFGTLMGMSNPHILHKSFHTRQPTPSTS